MHGTARTMSVALETTYGAILDAMELPEQIELLDDPFQQKMLRKFGAFSPLLRPKLLERLHQREFPTHSQPDLFGEPF